METQPKQVDTESDAFKDGLQEGRKLRVIYDQTQKEEQDDKPTKDTA